jgi:hypothetical protein
MRMLILLMGLQEAGDLDVRARVWAARYDGATLADGRQGQGTRVGVDELGIDSFEAAAGVEATWRKPGFGRLGLEAWTVAFEGSETLAGPLVYDDETYPSGTAVDASLDLRVAGVEYAFELWKRGTVRIEGEAHGFYFAGRAEVEGGGQSSKTKLNRPLLMPGLRSEAGFLDGLLDVSASLRGIGFSTQNVALRWGEFEAEAALHPWKGLLVGLGYRRLRIDVKATEDSTNFDLDGVLQGPYLFAGWRF